ncbi:L-gulonolactone oxidase 3 [Senna tora]|uniref:L-gulonolactone oxidase 3 n=1 Tax=Senna tora TaxID=362788 RepID=A0A834WC62_9FABA|nr:L-gulonolactone oxidase 3 [Senna tora]
MKSKTPSPEAFKATLESYLYTAVCLEGYQVMSANSYFFACSMYTSSIPASLVKLNHNTDANHMIMDSPSLPPPRTTVCSRTDKPTHTHTLPIRCRHQAEPALLNSINQFPKSDAGIRRDGEIDGVDLNPGVVVLSADEKSGSVIGRASQLGNGVREFGDDFGFEAVSISVSEGGEEVLFGCGESDGESVTGGSVTPRAVGVEESARGGVALEWGRRS